MKLAILVISAFLVGFLVRAGTQVPSARTYQAGRVSACKDVLSAVAPMLPGLATVECTLFNNEAAMKAGDNYFALDGSKKLN